MKNKKKFELKKITNLLNVKTFYFIYISKLCLVLLLLSNNFIENLVASEKSFVKLNNKETPVGISIGGFCYVALALKYYGIRNEAYPFDWVLAPSQSLIKVINEDFLNYFSIEYMQGPINVYTGMTFLHDFPSVKQTFIPIEEGESYFLTTLPEKENEYEWNYKKYLRRIKRFKKVLSSNKPVVLFRSPATKAEALIIRDIFKSKYPLLNFTLVVINQDISVHEGIWNEEGILNYYIAPEKQIEYSAPEWSQIMSDTKLISLE